MDFLDEENREENKRNTKQKYKCTIVCKSLHPLKKGRDNDIQNDSSGFDKKIKKMKGWRSNSMPGKVSVYPANSVE